MILRRVIEHVKAQNWTAVALDFVIVVLGVFIGIQVANWNSGREDRALGEDYVKRLTVDLKRDLVATRNLAGYYDAVLASVGETDQLLSGDAADARQLVIAAYRASEIANTPPNRAIWDQIVSSGHLGLLPEGVIDSGLSEYYTFSESNVFADSLLQDSEYRRRIRAIIPLQIQIAMREGCSDVTDEIGVITGFAPDCRLAVDPSVLTATAEHLRSDRAVEEALGYQYSLVKAVSNYHNANIVLLERILTSLGEPMNGQ